MLVKGAQMRRRRKELRLEAVDVAARIGVSVTHLYNLELGHKVRVNYRSARALGEILGREHVSDELVAEAAERAGADL